MGGWLRPSCPHQELLLRSESREACASGWQSPGPVASKHSWPASIFPNLSAFSEVMLLSPSTARGIPWPGPRSRAPHAELRQRTPPEQVRESGVPGAPGQGSLQQSGGNQTSWDSG